MPYILILVALALHFGFSSVANAQSSPFGNLGDGQGSGEATVAVEGQTLASYQKALADYEKLYLIYTKSYGPQKAAFESQILAKGKDVMISKLGAIQTFINDLRKELSDSGLLPDETKPAYDSGVTNFQSFTTTKVNEINSLDSVDVLPKFSENLNKSILPNMQFGEVYIARISVLRGRYLIEKLMDLAPIIQAQINTAADVGADIEEAQRSLDSSMLILEGLKISYTKIEREANMASVEKTFDSDFMANTRATNVKLVEAYKGITETLTNLKTLYAQAPWDEALVEQLLLKDELSSESTEAN
uniref:DUF3829 domain-containing protein n=1 Tax=candidate division WWE3 bacterium TaxID=2053526 RepID=A0A7C4TIM5_UNCKA